MLAREHKEIDGHGRRQHQGVLREGRGNRRRDLLVGRLRRAAGRRQLANRLGAEIDIEAMETHLRMAFHHNRTIRGTEGTEGGSYQNTEQGLTAFLNHYVGSGNVLYVDRFFG